MFATSIKEDTSVCSGFLIRFGKVVEQAFKEHARLMMEEMVIKWTCTCTMCLGFLKGFCKVAEQAYEEHTHLMMEEMVIN